MSYSKTSLQVSLSLAHRTIEHIQHEYLKNDVPWYLGFSGGKDSSALLRLVYEALQNLVFKSKPVTVIYCDTGVEIPVVRSLVTQTLENLTKEVKENDVPIRTQIVYPPPQDKYFSKVIGRGYPPPSYKFRWCTDVLRIRPLKNFLNTAKGQSIILLGIRKGESVERDRILTKHKTDSEYYFHQSNNRNVIIYSPIVEYRVNDVWAIINKDSKPRIIDTEKLQILYNILDSGNSMNLSSSNVFNARGRFGCWTCTVVRQDRAVRNLIQQGHESLVPLFEFRNWLATIRDDPSYRWRCRRNGAKGSGPFTLEARKEILKRLLAAQNKTEWNLISDEEIEYIKQQWLSDSG
jgi:DNA sulfur modification protein DndC